jgi:Pectate lyase superfamily protein
MVKIMNYDFKMMNSLKSAIYALRLHKCSRHLAVVGILALSFIIYNSQFKIAFAQQPQAPAGTPLYSANAKYVNGMAPGYWATAGNGLTLSLSAGTSYCGNPPAPVSYPGGSLALTASATNYIYLDPANNCSPAASTSAFAAGQVPIATVVTGASSITSITDARTWFQPQPCTAGAGGAIHCSSLGTNQNITLTPSGTGASVITNLRDKGGQVFNVKAYGAAGDGVTDDTSAINSAEAAAEAVNGTVYFPSGTYMINSTIILSSPVQWEGSFASSNTGVASSVIKAAAALNPMIKVGHSNIEIDHLRIDGNAEAIEGILTQASGTEPRAYHVVMSHVTIQNFPLSNSSVVALDLGDYASGASNQYACADCLFYDLQVFSGSDYVVGTKAAGTAIYLSRENNHFYGLLEAGFNIGVLFGGGSYGQASGNSFDGGFFADNATADTSLITTATNISNTFSNMWFEGSSGPVLGAIPPGSYTSQDFNFYGCHFNTYSSTSIMDLTNLVGAVYSHNDSWDISNSGNIITSSLGIFSQYDDPFTSSLTFAGNNHFSDGVWTITVSIGTTTVAAGSCADQTLVPTTANMSNWGLMVNDNIYQNMVVQAFADNTPQIGVKLCNYTGASITPTAGTVVVKAHP